MDQKLVRFIKSLTILLILATTTLVHADPPNPPAGKVWVLNHEMSDEFDANSPNLDKWRIFDKASSWGRTASFDKRTLESYKDPNSDNYYMTINPMWYYEDERFPRPNGLPYYFAGGGLDTKELQTYGYFEVRVKPSDFPMGSGVFMNSRQNTSDDCNTKYGTELDIIENMGYTGPFNEHGNGSFNNYQHVNSHAKPYSDASGSCQSLPYESENSDVKGYALDEPLGFNTVGLWWKDEQTAMFYNNDRYFGTITPKREFYSAMPVIIVMETYGWGDDEKNATNPKPEEWMFEDDFRTKEERAVMYDWVRSWKLVDIDVSKFNNTTDNIKGLNADITAHPDTELSSTLIYSAKENRTVVATVYNPEGTILAEANYEVTKGIKSILCKFDFNSELSVADGYRIVYDIKEGATVIETATSIVNIIDKPLEKKLWRDGIQTSLPPGETAYTIDVKYEADVNCKIVIEIREPDGSWFGGGSANVSAGNSVASVNVTTPSPTTIGSNYFYKVYMHRQGFDWTDPQNVAISPTIYFNVENPLVPAIKIVTTPDEIVNNDTEFDIAFQYETYENGVLDIELINPSDNVVAEEHRIERIGSRTLTRTIDVDSVLTAAANYKIAIKFSPENDSFEALTDTIYNVQVSKSDVSVKDTKVKKKELLVYPNPTHQILNLKLNANQYNLLFVEIRDINGRVIDKYNVENKNELPQINVAEYASGMYLIKVISEDKIYTSNFIKL